MGTFVGTIVGTFSGKGNRKSANPSVSAGLVPARVPLPVGTPREINDLRPPSGGLSRFCPTFVQYTPTHDGAFWRSVAAQCSSPLKRCAALYEPPPALLLNVLGTHR